MIQRFGGGEPGIFPEGRGRLESMLTRMETTVYGHNPFEDILSKVAFSFQSILQYHPFVDGTKRTGIASAYDMLLLNDIILKSNGKEDSINFAIRVADVLCHEDPEKAHIEIVNWFKDRTFGIQDIERLKEYVKRTRTLVCPRCRGENISIERPFCQDCATQLLKLDMRFDGIVVKRNIRIERPLIKDFRLLNSSRTRFLWTIVK
jgi:death-on-curing protein